MANVNRFSKALVAAAGLVASALVLSGCSTIAPDAKPTEVSFKVCVLGDGGFGGQSFNDAAYQGVLQTQAEFGVHVVTRQVSSSADPEAFATQAAKLLKQSCGAFVAIGDNAGSIEPLAKKYSKIKFLIVKGTDYRLGSASGIAAAELTNVKVISFDSQQVGFMAGYLAAAQTETKVVAAFGSNLDSTEVSLLAGFYQGARYFNFENGGEVSVRGISGANTDVWASAIPGDRSSVASLTKKFIASGADVIYPVVGDTSAGSAALGAFDSIDAAVAAGSSVSIHLIGSVSDWYRGDAIKAWRPMILASAQVGAQTQVAKALASVLDATFAGGETATYLGDLQNGGLAITGENQVPYSNTYVLAADKLRSQIVSGQIQVTPTLGG